MLAKRTENDETELGMLMHKAIEHLAEFHQIVIAGNSTFQYWVRKKYIFPTEGSNPRRYTREEIKRFADWHKRGGNVRSRGARKRARPQPQQLELITQKTIEVVEPNETVVVTKKEEDK